MIDLLKSIDTELILAVIITIQTYYLSQLNKRLKKLENKQEELWTFMKRSRMPEVKKM